MVEIIKDIEALKEPAKPLEFLTEQGTEKEEGLLLKAFCGKRCFILDTG